MKTLLYLLFILLIILNVFPESPAAAADNCTGIKPGQKIYWEQVPMAPGQIGKVTLLKETPLYSLLDGNPKQVKLLTKGNTYKVYSAKGNYYGVGGSYYVKKSANVEYATPSKEKLIALQCTSPVKDKDSSKQTPVAVPPQETPQVNSVNLGPQISNLSTIASKAGMDKNGNAYLYMTLQGIPAYLAVVDLNTNKPKGFYKLGNSTSAWAMDVDSDGTVWIGGTTSGDLYSYNPNTNLLKDYGNVLRNKSDTSIQDLTVNDQYVYGSTAYGANVFAFNKKTGKTEFTLATGNSKIAKSVVADPDNQYLYVSSGSPINILKYDLSDKTKLQLNTENYQNDTYVERMKRIDNLLVLKFYPSQKANIYNVNTGTYLNEFMADSRGFSAKDSQTNEFYYTYQGYIYAYNLSAGTFRNTGAYLPGKKTALSLDFVQLKNNPSQSILTGMIDNNGRYFLYNPITNIVTIKSISLPSQPVNLYLLFNDPAMRYIYVNGFMTGGLTQYDPVTKVGIQLNGINQIESALFLNGLLYAGVYPKAKLVEIDPNDPWSKSSVKELVSLNPFGQDRITALASDDRNHLYAGTLPQYSSKGGLLLDYDLNLHQYQIYEDYIPNQSIISLLTDGSSVYGGTTTFANYQKSADGAKFFRFNPLNPNEKEFIDLPIKASIIMSLIKGPDGAIWGAADGTIFSYDPNANQFRTMKLMNAISGYFGNAELLVGKDGSIYGTIEGHLFKMNPADMSYKFLLESGAYEIAQDANGNIYYRDDDNLYLYPIK